MARPVRWLAVVAATAIGAGAATLGGVWLTVGFGNAALAPAPAAPGPGVVQGPAVLRIAPAALKAGGIAVAALKAAAFHPETMTHARVVDPSGLFDLQGRLAAARADLVAAQGQAALSRQQYARDRALFTHRQSVSQRALLTARTAMQADAQKTQQAQAALDDLRARMRARYGAVFADDAASGAPMRTLRSGAGALVAAAMPAALTGPPPRRITLRTASGQRVAARFLSPAPVSDPKQVGPVDFYLSGMPLEIGSQPAAAIPLAPSRPGVFIPDGAILWFGGQRWVYVATGSAGFARRPLPAAADLQAARGGLVAARGFAPGTRIVTRGAQLLLSQEIRPKDIKTECPDPPECDG